MKKNVTMGDIARELDISNVTVSNALTGRDGVSEELRKKVKSTAVKLGYQLRPGKKNEKTVKSENIGVLIHERFIGPFGSFYWALYNALIQELMKLNCYCILEILSSESEADLKLPKMISEGKISGLIVIGQIKHKYASMINSSFSPFVFVDFYDNYVEADCILTDSYYGMYRLTDYLIKMGHKNIGFVGTINSTVSIQDRYMGYIKAMMENNLVLKDEWVLADRDSKGIYVDVKLPEIMPTAFVCNCDEVAYNFMKTLKTAGYSIPGDVSVVGYDNYVVSNFNEPAVSTIEVNVYDFAKMAAETIVYKINNNDRNPIKKMLIGKPIIKDSVLKLNK